MDDYKKVVGENSNWTDMMMMMKVGSGGMILLVLPNPIFGSPRNNSIRVCAPELVKYCSLVENKSSTKIVASLVRKLDG